MTTHGTTFSRRDAMNNNRTTGVTLQRAYTEKQQQRTDPDLSGLDVRASSGDSTALPINCRQPRGQARMAAKHKAITLERLEKFLSKIYWSDVNASGLQYDVTDAAAVKLAACSPAGACSHVHGCSAAPRSGVVRTISVACCARAVVVQSLAHPWRSYCRSTASVT
jgi:hypothetical protein